MNRIFESIYFFVFPLRMTLYYKSGNKIDLLVTSAKIEMGKSGELERLIFTFHPWFRLRLFNINMLQLETVKVN